MQNSTLKTPELNTKRSDLSDRLIGAIDTSRFLGGTKTGQNAKHNTLTVFAITLACIIVIVVLLYICLVM